MQLICASENELESTAREIIRFAGKQRIWLFYGQMGAGKTTLIKAIASQFNVIDTVHSPSFNLINEYRNERGDVFFHFDLYRIKTENEALDVGADEYFESGDVCFIEWPEKIPNLLPYHYLSISISIATDMTRHIKLHHHGA